MNACLIVFVLCRRCRRRDPFKPLLGLRVGRQLRVLAYGLPRKRCSFAARSRPVGRVSAIETELVEEAVDRAVARGAARMSGRPFGRLKVNSVWKSFALLFVIKKPLQPPQLRNERRFLRTNRQVDDIDRVLVSWSMSASTRVSHDAAPAT
jgi:hypothetical protein